MCGHLRLVVEDLVLNEGIFVRVRCGHKASILCAVCEKFRFQTHRQRK